MFPGWAGVSAPAGEISSEISSVNPVRLAMTSIGARRLATSDASATACSASMAQASLPGCTGHQEAPASVSVLSPRFLDAAGHPVMTFRSDRIAAGNQALTGTLTVRGTTRPVTLTVTVTRCEVSRGSFTARATVRIDRTEFGITAARGLAARYLDLTVEVQCTRN